MKPPGTPGLPVEPPVNSTSSTLIQFPARTLETKLTVHCPLLTWVVTEICVQLPVVGMATRASLPPQLRSAMNASICPPPERTQARAV